MPGARAGHPLIGMSGNFLMPGRAVGPKERSRPRSQRDCLSWPTEIVGGGRAIGCGAHGFISKRLPGDELVRQIEQIRCDQQTEATPSQPPDQCQHPAIQAAGLCLREVSVLSLIAGGRSNAEVADALHLSINTIKT